MKLSSDFHLRFILLVLLGNVPRPRIEAFAQQTTYLVEDDHVIYEYILKQSRSGTLSTLPMCYKENATEPDDGSVKKSNKTMHEYIELVKRTKIPPITLNVVPQILQLVDLDEKCQKITMVVAVHKMWHDCRLSWTTNLSSLDVIHIATSSFRSLKIFTPPIRLLEALNPKEIAGTETQVMIYRDGLVYLMEEFSLVFSCNIDVRMFPFDYQICTLTFESVLTEDYTCMEYDVLDIESSILEESYIFVGRYMPSDQWSLTVLPPVISNRNSCLSRRSGIGNECLNSGITYKLFLRRNPDYQLINLLFPAFLIVAISSCVFIVPPNSGDKMGLSVAILLSLFMFSELMYDKMPETGTLPLLSEYFLVCIVLVSVSCIYASISSVLTSAGSRLPHSLHHFVSLVGPFLIFDMIKAAPSHSKAVCKQCQCQPQQVAAAAVTVRAANEQLDSVNEEADANVLLNRGNGHKARSQLMRPIRFRLDQPERLHWAALGALLDRIFFLLHLSATVCVLLVYLFNGYVPWTGYAGLNLSSEEMQYVCSQLHITDHLQPDLDCPEIYSNYQHNHKHYN